MADRVADGRGSSEALNFLGLGTTVGASDILTSGSIEDASPLAIVGVALKAATAISER